MFPFLLEENITTEDIGSYEKNAIKNWIIL